MKTGEDGVPWTMRTGEDGIPWTMRTGEDGVPLTMRTGEDGVPKLSRQARMVYLNYHHSEGWCTNDEYGVPVGLHVDVLLLVLQLPGCPHFRSPRSSGRKWSSVRPIVHEIYFSFPCLSLAKFREREKILRYLQFCLNIEKLWWFAAFNRLVSFS
jgi:hypothetical protein